MQLQNYIAQLIGQIVLCSCLNNTLFANCSYVHLNKAFALAHNLNTSKYLPHFEVCRTNLFLILLIPLRSGQISFSWQTHNSTTLINKFPLNSHTIEFSRFWKPISDPCKTFINGLADKTHWCLCTAHYNLMLRCNFGFCTLDSIRANGKITTLSTRYLCFISFTASWLRRTALKAWLRDASGLWCECGTYAALWSDRERVAKSAAYSSSIYSHQ